MSAIESAACVFVLLVVAAAAYWALRELRRRRYRDAAGQAFIAQNAQQFPRDVPVVDANHLGIRYGRPEMIKLNALRELVEEAQWSATEEYGQISACPWCTAYEYADGGHDSDCRAAIIMDWERKS